MTRTRIANRVRRTSAIVVAERVTSKPFRAVVDIDPAMYDDPDFVLTINIETVDPVTGRTRGARSTHTGRPMGKSGRWALGLNAPPEGLKTVITVSANKPCVFGLDVEEDETVAPRTRQEHHSIAFDEFDYAETSSSASTLAVTNVVHDAGDFLLAMASVFNSSGSTITVTGSINGAYTEPTGSPVLPAADAQGHIWYKTNAAGGTETVTFDPTGASSDIDAVVIEISGAAAAGFDQYVEATGVYNSENGATATVTSGTLAQANNLAFTITTHTGPTAAFTPHASYTLVAEDTDNTTAQALHTQRLTTPTAATTALTATVAIAVAGSSPSVSWGIAIIVVKESSGAVAIGIPAGTLRHTGQILVSSAVDPNANDAKIIIRKA